MLYLPSLVIGTVSTDIFADCNKKASLKKYLLGRNNNTKIHAAVDKQCRPIKLLLSAGNVNDIKVAPLLLDGLVLTDAVVIADKAYCSRKFLSLIESKGGNPCIPCKKTYKVQWKIDGEKYKKRNVVERFFQRLKENRRLAMRFDKRADRFFSFILFDSILLWLK